MSREGGILRCGRNGVAVIEEGDSGFDSVSSEFDDLSYEGSGQVAKAWVM